MSDTNNHNKPPKPKRAVVTLKMKPEDNRLLKVLSAALDMDNTELVASLVRAKATEHGLDHVLAAGRSTPHEGEDRSATPSGPGTDGELTVVTDTAA